MKYCSNCGAELKQSNQVVCLQCGCATNGVLKNTNISEGGVLWTLFGIFFWFPALIIYFIVKDDQPNIGRDIKKGLIGYLIFLSIVFVLVFAIGFFEIIATY